jgi:hypothetical protein
MAPNYNFRNTIEIKMRFRGDTFEGKADVKTRTELYRLLTAQLLLGLKRIRNLVKTFVAKLR